MANERYWVDDDADGDWDSANNWASSSGGSGGAGVPTSDSNVHFDANSPSDCEMLSGATRHCKTLVQSGYNYQLKATVVGGNPTLEVHNDTFTLQSGGLASTGTGIIFLFTNGGAVAITTAGNMLYSTVFNNGSGTYTLQDALTVSGDLQTIAGTFDPNDFDVSIGGDLTLASGTVAASTTLWEMTATSGTVAITSNSYSFSSFKVNGSGGTFELQDALTVLGDFEVAAGTFDANDLAVTIGGNLTLASGTVAASNTTWKLNATSGTKTITTNGNSLYDLEINGSGGTFQLQDALDITSEFDQVLGTFDANDQDVDITGNAYWRSGLSASDCLCGSGTWTLTTCAASVEKHDALLRETSTFVFAGTCTWTNAAGVGTKFHHLTLAASATLSYVALTTSNTYGTVTLGANSTFALSGGGAFWMAIDATGGNFVPDATATISTSGGSPFYISQSVNGTFYWDPCVLTGTFYVFSNYASGDRYVQLQGNITVTGSLQVVEAASHTGIRELDLNGYDLTVTGYLGLGQHPYTYGYGAIVGSSTITAGGLLIQRVQGTTSYALDVNGGIVDVGTSGVDLGDVDFPKTIRLQNSAELRVAGNWVGDYHTTTLFEGDGTGKLKLDGASPTIDAAGDFGAINLEIAVSGTVTANTDVHVDELTVTTGAFDANDKDITVDSAATWASGLAVDSTSCGSGTWLFNSAAVNINSHDVFLKETSTFKFSGTGSWAHAANISIELHKVELLASALLTVTIATATKGIYIADVYTMGASSKISVVGPGDIQVRSGASGTNLSVDATAEIELVNGNFYLCTFDNNCTFQWNPCVLSTTGSGFFAIYSNSASGDRDVQLQGNITMGGSLWLVEIADYTGSRELDLNGYDFTMTGHLANGNGYYGYGITVGAKTFTVGSGYMKVQRIQGTTPYVFDVNGGIVDIDGYFYDNGYDLSKTIRLQGSAEMRVSDYWDTSSVTSALFEGDGTGKLKFDGSGDKTINCGADLGVIHLELAKASGITQSSDVTVDDFTLTSGTWDMNDFDLTVGNSFTQTGGVFQMGSGDCTVTGDMTVSSGTVTPETSTLIFNKTTGAQALSVGGRTYYNVTVTKGVWDLNVTGTIVVDGDLVMTGTSTSAAINTGTVECKGNVEWTKGQDGTALIKFTGTGVQTAECMDADASFPHVEVAKTGGSLTFVTSSQSFRIYRDFTYTSGTVVTTGTVELVGNANCNMSSGVMRWDDVVIDKGAYATIITGTMYVDGDLEIKASKIQTGTLELQGDLDINDTGTTTAASYTLKFAGSNNQIWDQTGDGNLGNVEVAKTGGTLTMGNTNPLKVQRNITYTSGTVDAASSNLAAYDTAGGGPSATWNWGTVRLNDVTFCMNVWSLTIIGTLHVDGDLTYCGTAGGSVSGLIEIQGDLTSSDAALSGTAQHTLTGTGDQDIDVNSNDLPNGDFIINKPSGTAYLVADFNPVSWSGGLYVTQGVLDIDGYDVLTGTNFTVTDTLKLTGGETISVSVLTVDVTQSTVIYYGASSPTIDSLATGFFNLTLGASKTHKITSSSEITVAGRLDSDGLAGATASILEATSPGTRGKLTLSGFSTLADHVEATDIDSGSGIEVLAPGSTISNTVNWNVGVGKPKNPFGSELVRRPRGRGIVKGVAAWT